MNGLHPNRSISVLLGHVTLPKFLARFGNGQKISDTEKWGYNVTVDYRFYPAKENKYNALRGVPIAPFAPVHHFKNIKDFEIESSETNEF